MLATGMSESFCDLLLTSGFQLRVTPKGTLPFDTEATIDRASEVLRALGADPRVERVSAIAGAPLHVLNFNYVLRFLALEGMIQETFDLFDFMQARRSSSTCARPACVGSALLHWNACAHTTMQHHHDCADVGLQLESC